ncbi:hypothetical protein BH23PLA1_BH23PLA1_00310 [soil metagenome]
MHWRGRWADSLVFSVETWNPATGIASLSPSFAARTRTPAEAVRRRSGLRAPLFPLALALATGILIDRMESPWPTFTWALIAGLAALAALGLSQRARVSSWLVVLAFLALGGGWHHARWSDLPADDLVHLLPSDEPQPAWVRGVLIGVPSFRPVGSWPGSEGVTSTELAITGINEGDHWRPASGKALLTISGDRTDLLAGEPVQAAGTLSALSGPRNPGELDGRAALRARGIRLRLSVGDSSGIWPDPEGGAWPWSSWRGACRDWSHRRLIANLDPEVAPLASALLLGRRKEVDPEISEAFARTGTAHLLAISGLHLQALAAALYFLCRLLGQGRKRSFAIVFVLSIVYATLIGWMPSVGRSTAMTALICIAGMCDLRTRAGNVLSFAAIFTLLINPCYLFHVGWQLSFLAVAIIFWVAVPLLQRLGIAPPDSEMRIYALSVQNQSTIDPLDALERRLEPPWKKGLRQVWAWFLGLVVVSTVVSIACAPLIAWRFHLVSPIGILLNVPMVPMITLALLSAGATLLSSTLWEPLGRPAAWICEVLLDASLKVVRWADSQQWAYAYIPSPPTWAILAFYASLAVAAWSVDRRRPKPIRLATWGLVAAFGLLITATTLQPSKPGRLEVDVLAVDHGLAIVIQEPDGRVLLYDCGRLLDPRVGRRVIAPALWSRNLRHIDEVILTHADSDHYNGLPDLLDRFSVGVVRITPGYIRGENPGASRLLETVRAREIAIEPISAGDWLALGSGPLAEVLHPPAGWLPDASDNDRSVVIDLSWEGRHLLLTGDLDGSGLAEVLALDPRQFDAVLAPHHGGRTANPPWFYEWANPSIVAVSQGRPRAGTRDPLGEAGLQDTPIFRTWQQGAIRFCWEPSGLETSGFLNDHLRTNEYLVEKLTRMIGPSTVWVRWLVGVIGFAVGLILCLVLAVIEWGAWAMVLPGRRLSSLVPMPSPWELIETSAADGTTLRGWWRPSTSSPGRTALLLHGFGETGLALQLRGEALHKLGWNVVIPDARAFGQSGGDRASFGGREAADLLAWLDTLAVRLGPGFEPIVWGRSMGSAIALRAAAEDARITALILESPYADLSRTLARWLSHNRLPGPGLLTLGILRRAAILAGVSLSRPRPIDLAPKVRCPILILQGSLDPTVPPGEVRGLASAFPIPPEVIEVADAGHSNVFPQGGAELLVRIESFLADFCSSKQNKER